MNKKHGLLAVIMLVLAFNITPVFARPCMPVEVTKETTCERHPGYTTDPLYFELNGEKIYPGDPDWENEDLGAIPVYPLGEKLTFWIKIAVKANTDLTDVVVYDRLGGELMIDAIAFDSLDQIPDFMFGYDEYERNSGVQANGFEGILNKDDGLEIDAEENGTVRIFWTGNSLKAHFQWNVGDMDEGEERRIYLIVSTDTNPAGRQEYTSCGTYMLNSGATVKARLADTNKQVSNKSEQIVIKVIDD